MGLVKPPNRFARTNIYCEFAMHGALSVALWGDTYIDMQPSEVTVPTNIGAAPLVRRARGISSAWTMKKALRVAWCHSGGVSASGILSDGLDWISPWLHAGHRVWCTFYP